MAWLSFERFKIISYQTPLKLDQQEDDLENFNFAGIFDLMIGFDGNLPEDIGFFDFNLLTFGVDGEVVGFQTLSQETCN